MGLGGVEGAFRGPSPGDKGPAAPPCPGAAPTPCCGRGSALRLPGPPERAAPGAAGPERGGLFRGALSRSSSRGGGSSSSSRSGRLSLRLSVSHRGGEGGRRQAAGGGTGGGGGIGLRALGGGAAKATPMGAVPGKGAGPGGRSPREGESLVLVSAACGAGWRAESGASLRGRQFIGHLCSEAGSPGGRVVEDFVRRTQGRSRRCRHRGVTNRVDSSLRLVDPEPRKNLKWKRLQTI